MEDKSSTGKLNNVETVLLISQSVMIPTNALVVRMVA